MNIRPLAAFLQPLPPVSALTGSVTSRFDHASLPGIASEESGGGNRARPAPGKVTLTSRLAPSHARTAAEETEHPLALPSEGRMPAPTDDPFALHLETGASAAPSSAAQTPRLAVVPQMDFGEIPVGEIRRENVFAYNLHPSGAAFISAKLEGPASMKLGYPVPDRLRPSREDPGSPFPVVYEPGAAGVEKGVLRISAVWPEYTGWAPETVEVPILGTAYLYGQEPPSVVRAERERAEERARSDAEEQERAAALERAAEADDAVAKPYPQGPENRLEDAFHRAHDSLENLSDLQGIGIDVAAAEAESYVRRIPEWSPDLLTRLALHGLDMATYGIAGQVANFTKVTLSGGGKTTAGAAFVGDLVKQGLKNAGKAGHDAVAGRLKPAKGAESPADSTDARIAFFAQQRVALVASRAARQEALRTAHKVLRPELRKKHPETAAQAMNTLADGMDVAAQNARTLQADEARFAWMRFLSETALGSDLRNALDLPREGESKPAYDGLLDLDVSVDYFHPQNEMTIVRAKMNGVASSSARSLNGMPLSQVLEKGVTVRVNFQSPGFAVMPVVLVLDGDRIVYSDQTALEGQESHWLSLAGGYIGRPSPERQRLGAKALRNRLGAMSLEASGLQVKTDAA